MNRLVLGISLALTILLLTFRTPAAPAADAPMKERDKEYADSAIGAVIEANGGRVPATGVELAAALAKLGDFPQLAIPFSAVDGQSGLTHPRVVIAMRPSTHPAKVEKSEGGWAGSSPDSRFGGAHGGGGWGGSSSGSGFSGFGGGHGGGWGGSSSASGFGGYGGGSFPAPPPSQLGQTATNRTQLEGRLFLAANMGLKGPGRPVVKSVEFLSWNTAESKFDFGVMEGLGGGTPALKMLDGARCFSCHKNRGPILGDFPWSNTMHRESVRINAKALLKFPHASDENGKENPQSPLLETIDGMALLKPHAAEIDAAVRQGANLLRDRATFERLARTENGRKVLAEMLAFIVRETRIGRDETARFELDRLDLVKFVQEEFAARKAAPSDRLLDFNPVGTTPMLRYDAARAREEVELPSAYRPSNPKAYEHPHSKAPQHASELVSAMTLARAIGLSEPDRKFLFESLIATARELNSTKPSASAVAKQVFAGASFADVFATGVLPDRDDFKDRFVAGLRALAKEPGKSAGSKLERKEYASAPERDPDAKAEREKALIPSHACLACHDLRGAKPAAFNPIPPLAFDPSDAAGRAAWLKSADRAKRVQVLGRLVQRLNTDRDMPPEDSPEADAFRGKDLDAVKDWLATELKKAKGN